MVDAMPAAAGRRPEYLARVSIRTGMRVVAATGLHTAKYYDDVPWTREEGPDQLAQRFVADIEVGIDHNDYRGGEVDRSDFRAGIVKVGALTEELSDRDLRLFEAAAITQSETGVAVLTHTEGGRGGLGQIEALTDLDVPPDRIALSHTDKVVDPAYHLEMMSTGVNLCYDQALRWSDHNETARLIVTAIEEGHGGQLLLGTDGARRSLWETLGGGPGLAYLYTGFLDELTSLGLNSSDIETLFVHNPARFLTLGG